MDLHLRRAAVLYVAHKYIVYRYYRYMYRPFFIAMIQRIEKREQKTGAVVEEEGGTAVLPRR